MPGRAKPPGAGDVVTTQPMVIFVSGCGGPSLTCKPTRFRIARALAKDCPTIAPQGGILTGESEPVDSSGRGSGVGTAKNRRTGAAGSMLAPGIGIVRTTSPAGMSGEGSPLPIRYVSRSRLRSDIATPSGWPTILRGTVNSWGRRSLRRGVAIRAPPSPAASGSPNVLWSTIAEDEPARLSWPRCLFARTDETGCP